MEVFGRFEAQLHGCEAQNRHSTAKALPKMQAKGLSGGVDATSRRARGGPPATRGYIRGNMVRTWGGKLILVPGRHSGAFGKAKRNYGDK